MFLVEFVQNFPALTLVIIGLTAVLMHFRRDKRIKSFAAKIRGPPRYPFIGSALEFMVPRNELTKIQFKMVNLYGRRYVVPLGPSHYLVCSNASDIEKILSSSVHISKGDLYSMIRPWLGEGLLTSEGKKWQRRRKMLTPAFHFKILEDFNVVFNENAQIFAKILKSEFKPDTPKDIFPFITRCALDIICETAMDKKIDAQRERETPYVRAVYDSCELMTYRGLRPWLYNKIVWYLSPKGREWNKNLKILHGFTEQVIRERKAEQSSQKQTPREATSSEVSNVNENDVYWRGKKRLAFLDLLLDAQKNPENELTDLDIREEVDTFMFEGHDTTAASMGWTTFLLGTYREHQVKVIEELDSIFGDDKERPATPEDLTKMKYLEMCIKEALRLYPSVPFISRLLHTDLILDEDTIVPAGVNIVMLGLQIHRNEAVFPEPEVFMPERFLSETISQRNPFAYIPFSAGPRNCIGQKFALMEEKVVLSTLFRHFTVEAAERIEDLVVLCEVITRPQDGFKVKLKPRA